MNIPDYLQYTKDHEWIKIEDDHAIVGITEFAQQELGDIVFVEVDTVSEELQIEDVLGTIEAVKTVSDLFMPVDGKIIEFNELLNDSPELINSNPYDDGWIVKVSISDLAKLDHLISGEDYKKLIS